LSLPIGESDEEYQEIVAKHGVLLERYDAELVEPQSTDTMHIIEHKLAQAKTSFRANACW
jgi:hypothetical protein